MQPIIRVSALAVGLLLTSPVAAAAQTWGRPQAPQTGVCFYEDVNYGGDYFCAPVGSESPLISYRLNNRISSIRVFGNAEVTVYLEKDYVGRSRTIAADASDLRRSGWSDRISSYRVRSRGREGAWGNRWGRPSLPANGACFYEHINFEGQYFCVQTGERSEMVPEGTNDRISSIRLLGNAEVIVFRDRDFGGVSHLFQADARDLQLTGWNDRISSFRVESRGANRGNRGRGIGQGRGRGDFGGPTGRMEWRGRVDDKVHLIIRGQSVEQRTISGTPLSNGTVAFTSALPNEAVRVSVAKLSGRGVVRVIQQPARTNDFTAIVEIVDDAGGSQEYRIEVTWR